MGTFLSHKLKGTRCYNQPCVALNIYQKPPLPPVPNSQSPFYSLQQNTLSGAFQENLYEAKSKYIISQSCQGCIFIYGEEYTPLPLSPLCSLQHNTLSGVSPLNSTTRSCQAPQFHLQCQLHTRFGWASNVSKNASKSFIIQILSAACAT